MVVIANEQYRSTSPVITRTPVWKGLTKRGNVELLIQEAQPGRKGKVVNHQQAWAVVLAGGDGTRLRSLTRLIAGEDRPKQFCRLYGGRTLLAQTRSRLAHAISPERTLFAVVKAHERFYADELGDVAPSRVVVQPSNRGTTAAIICSLQRITSLVGDPIVGFFPTDHHYSREMQFVASVRVALKVVKNRPDTVILLGARAAHPEVEYGWIEPGTSLGCQLTNSLLRVTRFWEKPSTHVAQALLTHGCLWNTFVMIGRASAFLKILKAAVPLMVRALEADSCPSGAESDLVDGDNAYAALTPGDFSQQVLSVSTKQLAVLRLGDVGWSDLGTPERVMFAMARFGLRSSRQGGAHDEKINHLAKAFVS
jgi:mannose-1-phosphate guanylyltransferase